MSKTASRVGEAARAGWAPCGRACYHTLQWPAGPDQPKPAMACMPALPQPPHRLLALCDESGLRQLVHAHMRRLRGTALFAGVADCITCVEQRVADYVVEACGGASHHRRQVSLQAGAGLPLLLDEEGRELWLVQLWHAFEDVGLPEPLRADFWGWAEPLSVHLLAPRARHAALTRYPYDTVRRWFADVR